MMRKRGMFTDWRSPAHLVAAAILAGRLPPEVAVYGHDERGLGSHRKRKQDMKLHYNAKHECPARFARATVLGLLAGVVLGLSSPAVWAQEKKSAKEEEKTSEDVTLDTKDGVFLRCTYYPGPEKKTTVPLILLHDWDGNRGELHGLATFLNQTLNHSVIVPDLRGHGVSFANEAWTRKSIARSSADRPSRG